MKIIDVEQNSPQWIQARLGIPTASSFNKIITPKTRKPSVSAKKYCYQLIAEKLLGTQVEEFKGNDWTERGHELEPDAAAFYEFQKNTTLQVVGFITNDEGTFGCSPDRLIGEDGLLEIKCPSPQVHVEYLLEQNVDKEYYLQIQGQLLVTGRLWADVISYHPEINPVIIRVERDEEYMVILQQALDNFNADLQYKLKQIRKES